MNLVLKAKDEDSPVRQSELEIRLPGALLVQNRQQIPKEEAAFRKQLESEGSFCRSSLARQLDLPKQDVQMKVERIH